MDATMKNVKVACVNCGGQPRDHEVLHEHSTDWHDREEDELGGHTYQICKCQDCQGICFRHESWSTYDFDEDAGKPLTTVRTFPDPTPASPPSSEYERHPWLVQRETDMQFMQLAVDEARLSRNEPEKVPRPPWVGAVVARGTNLIDKAHRGENKIGEHAEYTLLEGKCGDQALAGTTVYTTLEPCTTRNDPKVPCVEWLIQRKVARVVIGMLDPDDRIRGRGILALRKANIQVDLFPPDLMNRLEELNRGFIRDREKLALVQSTTTVEPSQNTYEMLFRSQLASVLYDVLVWAETPAQMRLLNPWFTSWQNECGSVAAGLLDMAADEMAMRLGVAQKMRDVADALSEVSTFRSAIGSGSGVQLEQRSSRAIELISALKAEVLDTMPIDLDFASQIREDVKRASRKIADLSARARTMIKQQRTDELKAEVGDIGTKLAKLSFYEIQTIGSQFGSQLRKVGMRMRLVEAALIELDGGVSLDRLVKEVSECATMLGDLARQLADGQAVQHGVAPDDRPQTAARG